MDIRKVSKLQMELKITETHMQNRFKLYVLKNKFRITIAVWLRVMGMQYAHKMKLLYEIVNVVRRTVWLLLTKRILFQNNVCMAFFLRSNRSFPCTLSALQSSVAMQGESTN